MSVEPNVKQQVREFYDQVGWQRVGEEVYQNAHYEDLRPVARDYIHRCHLRLGRYLPGSGRFLLDAGSGPIQYPEYLAYSQGYTARVCADISITALKEARTRIGDRSSGGHGLFVVADVANLPFQAGAFDGIVSLHTIHHLPEDEHLQAYGELYRVLAARGAAAVVNGWPSSRLMDFFNPIVRLSNRLRSLGNRLAGRPKAALVKGRGAGANAEGQALHNQRVQESRAKGTFTNRHDVGWVRNVVGGHMPVEIFPWRSASVRFLRAVIHPSLGGRVWLRLLYRLEERFPRFFGENGQYPIIVIHKK